ncbi:hypothetical protein [Azospirillum sp.]|uniref:hypothetical protein n=1 Tax=Azospirillum sp. TaxID=34012 RepID=UPI003D70DA7A
MRRRTMRGAAVLTTFWAVFWAGLAAGPARAADCLLLDGPELETARAEGRCQDVFARSAAVPAAPAVPAASATPAVPPAPAAKAAPAKPAKAPRRTKAKAKKTQPSLATTLERAFNRLTTEPPVTVRRRGGVDHLSYGRTEPNPVER